MKSIRVGATEVGGVNPCFVIAEAGVNHNGELARAKELVDAAVEAGADSVKFQNFRAEELISASAPKAEYQEASTRKGESQLEMIRRLELSPGATRELAEYAKSRSIIFLSTGFDESSVDLLDELDVPVFKVGSGDVTNLPLLEYIGRKGRPIILSTGMSFLDEVESAVETLYRAGCPNLALLQCVSSYPADPRAANLNAMRSMQEQFDVPVGFSDHSLGYEVAIAAVALGAKIIEKHITLDSTMPGPDHRVSMMPEAFASMVRAIRVVESSLGDGVKRPTPSEQNVRDVARRSIVSKVHISKGARISRDALAFKRPGTGIAPGNWSKLIGRTALRDIPADSIISFEDLT